MSTPPPPDPIGRLLAVHAETRRRLQGALGREAHWPALAAWATPAGLVAAVGPHRTVPIELGDHYLAEGWGQQLRRFGRFVSEGMAASGGSGGGSVRAATA